MTNIVSFPKSKINEAEMRALQEEGDKLVIASRDLMHAISDWESRFLLEGEKYLSRGGNDPILVSMVQSMKLAKKYFSL